MLKFTGERKGRTFVAFGLSRFNIERLQAGKPILVDLAELGVAAKAEEVLIFAGDTEQQMAAELRGYGLISPDTIVRPDPDPQ